MSKKKELKHEDKPKDLVFQPEFIDDLRYWKGENPKTALRCLEIEAVKRLPFQGMGKPEPLRFIQFKSYP